MSEQGEGDGTSCAVVNQLQARLLQKYNKKLFVLTASFLVD
jgi:hypothetical protein